MLAAELQVGEYALTDDFQWLAMLGEDDAGYFLTKLNDAFTRIPSGFSFGAGKRLFPDSVNVEILEQIATVGGLVLYVERQTIKLKR